MIKKIIEWFILGMFTTMAIGMIILIPIKIGSKLIEQFGIRGLLLIPLVIGIIFSVGLIIKLFFPHFTIYSEEEE